MSNILAVVNYDGKFYGGIWNSWRDFYSDTFSPEYETFYCYDFTTKGKTYKDRKSYVQDCAIGWSNVCGLMDNDFSQGEWLIVESEFRRLGKRYGLLREFRINCIC